MSVGNGVTTFRFAYCAHRHDEGEECVPECHHDPHGCRHVPKEEPCASS